MRLSPVILLSAAAVVSAFQSPDPNQESWRPLPVGGGNVPEIHSLKLKRQLYAVSGTLLFYCVTIFLNIFFILPRLCAYASHPIRGLIADGSIGCDRKMVHTLRSEAYGQQIGQHRNFDGEGLMGRV